MRQYRQYLANFNSFLTRNWKPLPNFNPFMGLVALFFMVVFFLVFLVKLQITDLRLRNRGKLKNLDSDMNMKELFLVFGTFVAAVIAATFAAFVVQKLVRYSLSFFLQIFHQIIRNVIGAGLFCGFMTTATLGYFFYFVLVPRFFFENWEDSFLWEHHQKRVGAMTSFVTGQFLKFTWFYNRPLFEALFKRNFIILIFVSYFLIQVLWTHQTIVRNWRFLYRNDKRKRVVRRVLLLQLEFLFNFFLQLSPSDSSIEKPDSMVSRLVDSYLKDEGKKIFFLRSSFVGWLIGHIFFTILYMKLFGLIVTWAKSYYTSNNSNSRGSEDDHFYL